MILNVNEQIAYVYCWKISYFLSSFVLVIYFLSKFLHYKISKRTPLYNKMYGQLTDNVATNEWLKTRERCGRQINKKELKKEGDSELKIGFMVS